MTKKSTLFLILTLCLSASCSKTIDKAATDSTTTSAKATPAGLTVATISVPTTQCGTCEKTITTAVSKIDGVTSCDVDSKAHIAKVQFIPAKTNLSAIEHTIAMAGYTADAVERDSAGYAGLEDCCK